MTEGTSRMPHFGPLLERPSSARLLIGAALCWSAAALGAALVLGLPLVACAAQRPPVRVQVVSLPPSLVPGESSQLDALVVNRTKTMLRVERGSALRVALSCRRAIDPPGQRGLGTESGIEGGVYGGRTHGASDPADPHGCRSNPPPVLAIPAGGTLPLTALVETPLGCVDGEAELEISFAAPDHGRRCPGIWYGETPPLARRAQVRRRMHEPSS
jgi:hypothetical protein